MMALLFSRVLVILGVCGVSLIPMAFANPVLAAPMEDTSVQASITIGDVSGYPGGIVTVPIRFAFEPDRSVRVMVIHLVYDPSKLTVQIEDRNGDGKADLGANIGADLEASEIASIDLKTSEGKFSVSVVVADVAEPGTDFYGLRDGELIRVKFRINDNTPRGGIPLMVDQDPKELVLTTREVGEDIFAVALSNITVTPGTVTVNLPPLVTPPPPVITTPPLSQTVPLGRPVSFTVVATGTAPLNYEWQKDGQKIAGAPNNATLTIPSVSQADEGSYRCVVSNAGGPSTSGAATLTVSMPPVIDTQPDSKTVVVGSSVSFTVGTRLGANGVGPLRYQWQKNQQSLAGQTNGTYTISSVAASDAGAYRCVVADGNNLTTRSAEAALTVNPLPKVATPRFDPNGGKFDERVAVTLSTTTAGAMIHYTLNGTDPASTNGTRYTVPFTLTADATVKARAFLTGMADSDMAQAIFDINHPPVVGEITHHAVDADPLRAGLQVVEGTTVRYSGVVSDPDSDAVSWEWFYSVDGGAEVPRGIKGVNPPTPVQDSVFPYPSGAPKSYVWILRGSDGRLARESRLTVEVLPAPLGPDRTRPTVPQGLAVAGVSTSRIDLRWDASTDPEVPGEESTGVIGYVVFRNDARIADVTAPLFSDTDLQPDATYTYTVAAVDKAGNRSDPSQPVQATTPPQVVKEPPSITGEPADQEVGERDRATFRVEALGTEPLRYQWQKNGKPIPGATASSHTTPPTTPADDGAEFQCVVANDAGTAHSRLARLTVHSRPVPPENQPPVVAVEEGSLEIRLDEEASLRGSVSDDGLPDPPHQVATTWSEVTGPGEVAFASPFALQTTARFSQVGGYLLRLTANDGELEGHADLRVTVHPEPVRPVAPEITRHPQDEEVREGQTATFRMEARGTPPLIFQWQKNGDPILAANDSSYTTPPVTLADDGAEFRCVVTNEAGTVTSDPAKLTVREETGIQLNVTATPSNGSWIQPEDPQKDPYLQGTVPLTVAFDVTASMRRGRILRYEWDFIGLEHYDYLSSETGDVEYTYAAPGEYLAAVRVIGTRGAYETFQVKIVATPHSQTPELNLSADPLTGQAPLPVTLRAAASSPNGIAGFAWDFNGDGQADYEVDGSGEASEVSKVIWEYTEGGLYKPMVTATDLAGLGASRGLLVDVRPHPESPQAVLNVEPLIGTAPLAVKMTLTSSDEDLEEELERVAWDFDGDDVIDRITHDLKAVEHTYGLVGRYRPIVWVRDGDHRGSKIEGPEVTVEEPQGALTPTASFTAAPDEGPAPLEVLLTNTSTSPVPIVESIWFGDEGRLYRRTERPEESISHTFHHVGPTWVYLLVRNDAGLVGVASHLVTVTEKDRPRIRLLEPELSAVVSGTVPVVVDLGPRLHPTRVALEGASVGGEPVWVTLGTLSAPLGEPPYLFEWDTTASLTSHPNGAFHLRVRVEDPFYGTVVGPVSPVRIDQEGSGVGGGGVGADLVRVPAQSGEERRWLVRIYVHRARELEVEDELVLGIPAGTTIDDETLTVAVLDPSQVTTPLGGEGSSVVGVGIYHRIELADDETGQLIHHLQQPIRLEIRYPDGDQNGFVDGTDIPETSLRIYTRNTDVSGAPWEPLADLRLDPVANQISGTTPHLSLFGLGGILGGIIGGGSSAVGGGDGGGGGILGALGGGSGGGGGGCFIATAAFGTPMAPELDLLRKFRDEQLLTNPSGRALIQAYYRTAPPVARFIEDKPALRWAVRQALKPILWYLETEG